MLSISINGGVPIGKKPLRGEKKKIVRNVSNFDFDYNLARVDTLIIDIQTCISSTKDSINATWIKKFKRDK